MIIDFCEVAMERCKLEFQIFLMASNRSIVKIIYIICNL